MEESIPVPDEQPNTLSSEARELLETSTHIYTQMSPCKGDFRNRTIDTRTKGKPINGDLENINKVIMELMKQCRVSPTDNPFSYISLDCQLCALFCCHSISFAQGMEKTRVK